MTLKELLGDAYKEGITETEIDEVLKGKKLVDLKTGNYVDKDKYEKSVARVTDLENELTGLKESTKDYSDLVKFKKTTEEEKEKASTIEDLKKVGFKDEFIDYALYQIQQGAIAKGEDGYLTSGKEFLKTNAQYGNVVDQQSNPTPTISTILGADNGVKSTPIPQGVSKSWNKNRS